MNEEDFGNLGDGFQFSSITMTDNDGNEVEFAIIDQISIDDVAYLLVINGADMGDDEAEAYILKEIMDEADEITYELIEDDEEFNKIAKSFNEASDGDYDIELV